MNHILTIAASDNSGGAGVQKDIMVAHDLGYHALSAITGITVQNFTEVFEVVPVNASLLQQEIEACCQSFPIKAVKIGAICSAENIKAIARSLSQYGYRHVVLDTVIASTSGRTFLDADSLEILKNELFPLAEIITPNKPEFEILTCCTFSTLEEGIDIAKEYVKQWNTSILLKGGHFNDATIKEAIVTKDIVYRFERERQQFTNSHGTGCTLSSALACNLGHDVPLQEAYTCASEYLARLYQSY